MDPVLIRIAAVTDEPCCAACAIGMPCGDVREAAAEIVRTAALATQPFDQPFPTPEYIPPEWLTEEPTWIHDWRAEHGYGPAVERLASGKALPRLTVTDEGRVGGYFRPQGVCLVDQTATMKPGQHECWVPGPSPTSYARFHQQDAVTTQGQVMLAGVIGNVGGHASPFASGSAASAHYADPNAQMIICRLGDAAAGGWLAGALVPGLTFGDVALLRRCALSGDWRWFRADAIQASAGYDCLGPTLVTRPGLALVQLGSAGSPDDEEHPDYFTPSPLFGYTHAPVLASAHTDDYPPEQSDQGDAMRTLTRDGIELTVPDEATDDYIVAMFAAATAVRTAATLATKTVNDLPDSAFAYIEPGGTKDSGGLTVPRSKRHFPIPDAAHVRAALSRIGQGAEFSKEALPAVKAAAKKFGIDAGDAKAAGAGEPEIVVELGEGVTARIAASPAMDSMEMPDGIDTTDDQTAPIVDRLTNMETDIDDLQQAVGAIIDLLSGSTTASAAATLQAAAAALPDHVALVSPPVEEPATT